MNLHAEKHPAQARILKLTQDGSETDNLLQQVINHVGGSSRFTNGDIGIEFIDKNDAKNFALLLYDKKVKQSVAEIGNDIIYNYNKLSGSYVAVTVYAVYIGLDDCGKLVQLFEDIVQQAQVSV